MANCWSLRNRPRRGRVRDSGGAAVYPSLQAWAANQALLSCRIGSAARLFEGGHRLGRPASSALARLTRVLRRTLSGKWHETHSQWIIVGC